MKPITNTELQKIYDLAKADFISRHNVEYEAHLWTVLVTVKAACAVLGFPVPVELHRDFYGPDSDGDYQSLVLEPKDKK